MERAPVGLCASRLKQPYVSKTRLILWEAEEIMSVVSKIRQKFRILPVLYLFS